MMMFSFVIRNLCFQHSHAEGGGGGVCVCGGGGGGAGKMISSIGFDRN